MISARPRPGARAQKSGGRRWKKTLLLGLGSAWVSLVGAPAAGQQEVVAVEAVQGLRFEFLEAGTERIGVRDPARRGEWLVYGQGAVEINVVLPRALINTGQTGEIPLEFGYGDLAFVLPGTPDLILADPNQPLLIRFPENGLPVRILLGGVALSTGEESAGDYGAPVSLLLTQTGSTP
ncbi:hypothetical protein ACFL3S_08250 [Gemmatimonadota bacterium]